MFVIAFKSTSTPVKKMKVKLTEEPESVSNHPIIIYLTADRLAQLIEHRTTVREIVGSNPAGPTLRVFK